MAGSSESTVPPRISTRPVGVARYPLPEGNRFGIWATFGGRLPITSRRARL